MHSALKFVTPVQRHNGVDLMIRKNRHEVYQAAREQHPERWSGQTRNWVLPGTVTLNPNKKNRKTSNYNRLKSSIMAKMELPEQERPDGAGDGSRQAADAVRQYG